MSFYTQLANTAMRKQKRCVTKGGNMSAPEDRNIWFEPIIPNDDQAARIKKIREAFQNFNKKVDSILGEGRRKSIVLTHIEEASHMAIKSITHG